MNDERMQLSVDDLRKIAELSENKLDFVLRPSEIRLKVGGLLDYDEGGRELSRAIITLDGKLNKGRRRGIVKHLPNDFKLAEVKVLSITDNASLPIRKLENGQPYIGEAEGDTGVFFANVLLPPDQFSVITALAARATPPEIYAAIRFRESLADWDGYERISIDGVFFEIDVHA